MTPSLLRHRKRDLALQLLERQLRTTPVTLLTGLPESEVRKLYRMLHDRSPSSGPMQKAATLIPNRRAHIQASVFAAVYRRLASVSVTRTVDPQVLMQSYDVFRDFTKATFENKSSRPFDFTAAWVIARDLCDGEARMKSCPPCAIDYLVVDGSAVPHSCPFFALRAATPRTRVVDPHRSKRQSRQRAVKS
jgi:hypothetical protein